MTKAPFKSRIEEIQLLLARLESSTLSDQPKEILTSEKNLEVLTSAVQTFLDEVTDEEKKAHKDEFISLMASLNITLQKIEIEKQQVRTQMGKLVQAIQAQKGYKK